MKLNITLDGRRFYRSTSNSWIFGISGGLANHFGWNSNYVRAFTVAAALLVPGVSTLGVIVLYIALGLLIPSDAQA